MPSIFRPLESTQVVKFPNILTQDALQLLITAILASHLNANGIKRRDVDDTSNMSNYTVSFGAS